MSDEYFTPSQLRARGLDVTGNHLRAWSVHCPSLGRAIAFEDDPGNPRNRKYLFRDVRKALESRNLEPLPDEFTDAAGRWMWASLLPNKCYKFSRMALYNWSENGCAGLDGQKLRIRTEHSWHGGSYKRRDFVRAEDLDRIIRWKADSKKIEDQHWMSHKEASSHLSATFLTTYSDSRHHRRNRVGVPHPLLGRTIKTELRDEVTNGQTVSKLYLWRADILKLIQRPERAAWATWREAQDEYNLPHGLVRIAVRQGKIQMKKFPGPATQSRPVMQQYFYRPHLEAMAAQRVAKASLPVATEVEDRSSTDAAGRWLPTAEAENRVGVRSTFFTVWRKKCPHLDGKPFRARQIKPAWKSSRSKIWVYNEADADRIHRKINNLPEPVAVSPGESAKPKKVKAKRGRPRADQKVAEFNYRIARDWKKAQADGETMATFGARTRDIDSMFLGKNGLLTLLRWVERNPKRAS
jgi:hypothetical protein